MRVEKLEVHQYWTSYFQAIQKSLGQEYYYFVSGIIKNKEKIHGILHKFDEYYRVADNKHQRYLRYKDGYSVSIIHLLKMGDNIAFIVMTRQNNIKGLFFEREKYGDARDKNHRINLNECYEFIRINKEVFDPITKVLKRTNEVWTVDLTEKEKLAIVDRFNKALIKRNYMEIKQICYGLHHLIGFHPVRATYLELKEIITKRFDEFSRSEFEPKYHSLDKVYKLPKKIGCVRFSEYNLGKLNILFL